MSQTSEGSKAADSEFRPTMGRAFAHSGPLLCRCLGMTWWSVVAVTRAEWASRACLLGTGRLLAFCWLLERPR